MEYFEFFKSEEDIVNSDNVTKEAYKIAKKMYEPLWASKNKKGILTNEKLYIVDAFNLAEEIKQEILAAGDNYSATINKVCDELFHWFPTNRKKEVSWLYQRNFILGIVYYLLAGEQNINAVVLNELQHTTEYVPAPLIPNIRIRISETLPFFNEFFDEVKKKNKQDSELVNAQNIPQKVKNDEKDMKLVQNTELAQGVFDQIFRDGLDMMKIYDALNKIFKRKDYPRQQRNWYIIYLWFFEIEFIPKRRSCKKFRTWAIYMFGEDGYSTEHDFDKAAQIARTPPSTWNKKSINKHFIIVRDMLIEEFPKEKRDIFLKKNRYIDWNL